MRNKSRRESAPQQAAVAVGAEKMGLEYLDIPAFLRRQAD
jgi:hypothetical protein